MISRTTGRSRPDSASPRIARRAGRTTARRCSSASRRARRRSHAERRAPGELPPARVQVWHWKDVREFHQQEVSAGQDRSRTTLVAWHVGGPSVVRLSDDPLETVQLSENGAAALASDEGPYAREFMSGRQYRDVYSVDVATGKRTKILTKSPYGATLSPSGRYATYQQDGQWMVLDLQERYAHESHRQAQGRLREHRGRSSGAGASRVRARRLHDRREVGARERPLRPLADRDRRIVGHAPDARPRGFDRVSLRERRRWSAAAAAAEEGGAAAGRDRRRANSTAKAERSTRPSRSCCRRPASTTRRAATRGSRSASRRSSSSGSTRA